jgi:hypothetical protein
MLDEGCNRELHYEVLSVYDLCIEFVLVRNVVLRNREIRKFTVFRPPSSPKPSFSGSRRVMKYYYNSLWNAETQHLMHKVREEL